MEHRNTLLVELHFLPCTSYFSLIKNHSEILVEAHEHYQKQSYRNRAIILTSNKIDTLTIPVEHSNSKMLIRDVKLVTTENWNARHWRSITAAYRKAPYFEYFGDYFSKVFFAPPKFLFDFNFELLSICLKLLQISPTLQLTDEYRPTAEIGQFDARGLINAKKQEKNVIIEQLKPYQQNFGNNFVPNLSVIDLLMCQGNRAKAFL